jgi:DNA mismatch repair protein MutL
VTPPRIQVLPPEVVEQIAAGEVVERPASVVKELVENSLDAGAHRITVETEAGGKACIRVADDGYGMTPEEAGLALMRHATSKLRATADLFNIRTLGFRGEALPSIAAVAEMEVVARRADVHEGSRLLASAGRLVMLEPAAAPVGTTVTVRRLFFNVPARQKFLKSDAAEAGEITKLVQRLALSHPEVSFLLLHDGREALCSPGSGDPFNAIVALLGRASARELNPIPPAGDSSLQASGFAGLPTLSRASRDNQLFFVNGRPVRSPLFYRAIDDAYRSRLPSGRHAVVVLFLEIDPADVDVNVHPAKTEVRFHGEPAIHSLVRQAIEAALAQPGRQDAGAESAPPEHPSSLARPPLPGQVPPAMIGYLRSPGQQPGSAPPAEAGAAVVREAPPRSAPADAPGLAELPFARAALQPPGGPPLPRRGGSGAGPAPDARPEGPAPGEREGIAAGSSLPELRLVGQAQDLFILAEGAGRLWIIDQHVAHERVLFDDLAGAGGAAPWHLDAPAAGVSEAPALDRGEAAEPLLLPLTLELDARQLLAVTEHLELLAEMGFAIDPFGSAAVRVQSVPRSLHGSNYEQALRDMIDELAELSNGGQVRLRRDQLALAAAGRACKAAVKAGMSLTTEEMERLLADLRRTRNPFTCPHGRPVFVAYEEEEIARLFGPTRCE